MVLDFTAYDANASLDVAAKIYNVTSGTPSLVTTVALAHVINGSYFAQYSFDADKEYLVSIAAYTDGTYATLDSDYTPSAKIVQLYDANISAIKNQTDQLVFDGTNVMAKLADGQITIKKGVAFGAFQFLLTDDSSHDPSTGLSAQCEVSIDGAPFAASTNAPVEVGSGIYAVDLEASEMDGDMITLRFFATGADTRFVTFTTQA